MLVHAALLGSLLAAHAGSWAEVETRCDQAERSAGLVSEVYPTDSQLPANLLRFYIYFSRPMTGDATLLETRMEDAMGIPIEGVFFSNRFALWSPDRKRLTLLLDPGRVKTGLESHEALGRAFEVGESYALTIRTSEPGKGDCPKTASYTKRFTIAANDTTIPNLKDWNVTLPRVSSDEPLILSLNGPHDHLSLAYRIRVKNALGVAIAGSIGLDANESEWRFTPKTAWVDQPYKIVVDPTLEDIAGNRLTGLFDDPTGRNRTARPTRDLTEIHFRPDI